MSRLTDAMADLYDALQSRRLVARRMKGLRHLAKMQKIWPSEDAGDEAVKVMIGRVAQTVITASRLRLPKA